MSDLIDKRDLGRTFQDRLRFLIDRFDGNQSQFAETISLDRSALSQILAEGSTRLPRAETLCRIADAHDVSLDWLLGLRQSDDRGTQFAEQVEIEMSPDGDRHTEMEKWHRESLGAKIRYVPKTLPDLLRIEEVTLYEFQGAVGADPEIKINQTDEQLAYSRRPETDIEACMPRQRLEMLAQGAGIWAALPASVRQKQLAHMAALIDELYPTFRLFLYDELTTYSAPYTVFGPIRAAIYVGGMYVVINTTDHIRALARHFDGLIRQAEVTPDRAMGFVRGLG